MTYQSVPPIMSDENPKFSNITEKLLSETAMMPWRELQRFFAQGAVLVVANELDLVKTAELFATDAAEQLEPLLADLKIKQPLNEQARTWYNDNAELWTVVVAPYVLVQEAVGA